MCLIPCAFDKQISQLKKNKKYLLYCKGGKRSGKALVMMQQKGFKNLYHLVRGHYSLDTGN